MNPDMQSTLIQSLQQTTAYQQEVSHVDLLETHISYVLLTGDFAYKIKKVLNLGFLDFSTLVKRHFCCQEELRLNRRLAPDLYLDVVAITGSVDRPFINGDGPAIEYAVKMRQFAQDSMLDQLEIHGKLRAEHIDQIANKISAFHQSIPVASRDSPYGSNQNIRQPALENFEQIKPLLHLKDDFKQIAQLLAWTEGTFATHQTDFAERKANGFIRECHGDMHLGNMALIEDAVTIFDCIEFNENLRWIDVISEIAFVVMDLLHRNQSRLAWRFLNHYLEITGDYAGIKVLRYYLVYRALVRAKVTCIRASQPGLNDKQRDAFMAQYRQFIQLAESLTQPSQPALLITHGFSGSGKTTLSQPVLEALGAIRIRSDVERKRLFDLAPLAKSGSEINTGIYSADAGDKTYSRLATTAQNLITAGFSVIADATFLKREDRSTFRALATALDVPFFILDFIASENTLRTRIAQREKSGTDASEANLNVLVHQLNTHHPLTPEESTETIHIDAEQANISLPLFEQIKSRINLFK